MQNTQKDTIIIKLQSQLDANQQELEYTVEELGQKSENLEQMDLLLDTLREKCNSLQQLHDEAAKKVNINLYVHLEYCCAFCAFSCISVCVHMFMLVYAQMHVHGCKSVYVHMRVFSSI